MAERIEILISGFGGQGVLKAGQILGTASVLQGFFTTMLVSHGTETRGGYVRTQIVMSDEDIDSPILENPTFFCALSKAAYQKFYQSVSQGVIVYDSAYIQPSGESAALHIAFPARDLAVKNLGNEMFANMIVYGKLISLLKGKITKGNAIAALSSVLNKKTAENIQAFDIGYCFS